MSLKQSYFKTVVKSDLKRSWWISALVTLFIFMSSTSPLFEYSLRYNYNYSRYDDCLDFVNTMFGNYIFGMLTAVFAVLYLFSYLNKVNSVSFFHGLPATRTTLFFAHITSSAVIVSFPMLVNSLISFLAVGRGVKASWILAELAVYLVYSFVILAVTLTISMLTGVSVAGGIFTGIFILLPIFLCIFALHLCYDYLYGFSDYGFLEETLTKFVYLFPEALLSAKVLVYIAGIIGFLALSLFLYKKRHLENYGEVIAFPQLKGLFKVIFALCAGILGYYYFDAFWGIKSILTMLVFGTLGAIIANMLTNKSLSLKGSLRPILVTAAFVVILFVAFFFDIFGYEKKLPKLEDIKYAQIGGMYYDEYNFVDSGMYGEERIRVERKYSNEMFFDTEEEIQYFLNLHEYALEHQKENDIWDDDLVTPTYKIADRDSFSITYVLKNGKTMERKYSLPVQELDNLTYPIFSSDTYKKWKYPILDDEHATYTSLNIVDARTLYEDDGVTLSAGRDDAKRLIEAIKKDKANMSYSQMEAYNYGQLVKIEVCYTLPYVSSDGKEYQVEHYDDYEIGRNDKYTWAVLEELNLFADKMMIEPDYIESVDVYLDRSITVSVDDYNPSSYPTAETVEIYDYDYNYTKAYTRESMSFTEKEDIELLYNLYMNHDNEPVPKSENGYLISLFLRIDNGDGGTTRIREILISESELPEILFFVKDTL